MDNGLPEGLGSRFGDINDLPEELRSQIAAVKIDALEQTIIDLLRDAFDGAATVDEIRVGIFRATGEIVERKKVAGKLYRMVSAEPPLLASVEKKRGVYRIP